jgi:hypothetical protein
LLRLIALAFGESFNQLSIAFSSLDGPRDVTGLEDALTHDGLATTRTPDSTEFEYRFTKKGKSHEPHFS